MVTKWSYYRILAPAVFLLVAVLACPAVAQNADTVADQEDQGLTQGVILAIAIVMGGIALIALVIAAREFGGSHSNVHRMRRRYFETCRQRRGQPAAHSGSRNGVPGP